MLRNISYYLLSIVIIILQTIALVYVLVTSSGEGLFALFGTYYAQYFLSILIAILQLIIIITYVFSKKTLLKFLVSLTATYSFAFFILYVFVVKYSYDLNESMGQIYTAIGNNSETASLFTENVFWGMHTFFVVPAIFQTVIFIFLFNKNKRILLYKTNETFIQPETSTT